MRESYKTWAEKRLASSVDQMMMVPGGGGPSMGMPGIYSQYYPPEYEKYASAFGDQLESVGWSWWDTQPYVSGTTTSLVQWFNVRATPDLSNMQVAFQLSAPQAFLLRAIRFMVAQRPRSTAKAAATNPQTGALDNIALLTNTGVFNFTIGQKLYVQQPLWVLTAGAGPAGGISAEGATADPGGVADFGQNGIADPRAVWTLSKPIFIKPQMSFTATMAWPAALTLAGGNTDIKILLDGDLLRSVQ